MVHTYATYPISLMFLPKRNRRNQLQNRPLPTVAVVIPAYNEEAIIREKLHNTLGLDYPQEKIEVLVGSDGSTDDTDRVVQSFEEPRIKLFRFEGRNGKSRILNLLAEESHADVMLLTDANAMISGDFPRFMQHFTNDDVAAVGAANLFAVRSISGVDTGERLFHLSKAAIKKIESDVGGFSGLEGAAYAIRKSAWKPLPLLAVNDDIVSLCPAVLNGHRIVFESALIATEALEETVLVEFKRRIRMGMLNWGTITHCKELLSIKRPLVAYTFFSSKVIQWIFPVLMILALFSNIMLIDSGPIYRTLILVQLTFYAAAGTGGLGALIGLKIPILYQMFSFLAVMTAFLIGGFRFLAGHGTSVWERSAR